MIHKNIEIAIIPKNKLDKLIAYGVPLNKVKLNACDMKLNGIVKICSIKQPRYMEL